MFIRRKKSGTRVYLQVVESYRDNGKPRQRVLWTIGQEGKVVESRKMDDLMRAAAGFSEKLAVLDAVKGESQTRCRSYRIGPSLVFEKLWRELGLLQVIETESRGGRHRFSLERAVFLTVLHRLFSPGSDRAAEKWKDAYRIEGAKGLGLQHLYRAMGWLGEPVSDQDGASPFGPRCRKDVLEEALFARRRNLFSDLDLVFFDTTSIYFEGAGGESLGQHGHSKDHRPDLRQMVVGVILDSDGNPVCSELWPGNTTDVKSLLPVVDRLKKRFSIGRICIVADRGMISRETIRTLESEEYDWQYILGVRMRRNKNVKDDILARAGRYREVTPGRKKSTDPSPLKVKDVYQGGRRYVVCHNEEQVRKDRADRDAIVSSLREQLKRGDKSLVGNKGYRRYLKGGEGRFSVDEKKLKEDARYDGKWVLQTNTTLSAEEVALKYKQLWMVEDIFRSMKTLLETRPIYHKCDETIRGHVFCSFLALVLRKELQDRLAARGGSDVEWADLVRDLDNLTETEVDVSGKAFLLRAECRGVAGRTLQAAGVAAPPTLRQL